MFHAIYKLAVMLVIPILCIVGEVRSNKSKDKRWGIGAACSKWFVFWTIGFSAITTGCMQVFMPSYTANLLKVDPKSTIIIGELGFANIAIGLLALLSLWRKELRKPAALTYGIYILGCTLLHIGRLKEMNLGECISLGGDIWTIIVVIIVVMIFPLSKKNKKIMAEEK